MGEPEPQDEEEHQPTPEAEGVDWKVRTLHRADQ